MMTSQSNQFLYFITREGSGSPRPKSNEIEVGNIEYVFEMISEMLKNLELTAFDWLTAVAATTVDWLTALRPKIFLLGCLFLIAQAASPTSKFLSTYLRLPFRSCSSKQFQGSPNRSSPFSKNRASDSPWTRSSAEPCRYKNILVIYMCKIQGKWPQVF